MRFLATCLTTLATVTLLASTAGATTAPGVEDLPPAPPAASLRLDVGIASPVGFIGLVYSRPLAAGWYGVEFGVGAGASGLQLSAMGKLRAGDRGTRFTPGLGLSVGIGGEQSAFHTGHPPGGDFDEHGDPVTMFWLDVDLLGVEHRTEGGLLLTASAGFTFALNGAHYDFGDLGGDIGPGDPAPQLRFGLGWVF